MCPGPAQPSFGAASSRALEPLGTGLPSEVEPGFGDQQETVNCRCLGLLFGWRGAVCSVSLIYVNLFV